MNSRSLSGALVPDALIRAVAAESDQAVSPDYAPLVDALKLHFGAALDAVILYGSCLHSGCSLDEGIVDLYAVVDDYRNAYPQRYLSLLNTWLPPNVFYIEVSDQGRTLRAKYAVISMHDFEQGASVWFHSYVWARFAQPSRLLYARDDTTRRRIYSVCAHSVITFLKTGIAALESDIFDVEEIWSRCLVLTYAAELRAEKASRARHLARANLSALVCFTDTAYPLLTSLLEKHQDDRYRCVTDSMRRRQALRRWRWRRWQGRILSILRLAKATLTFANSVDYAAWKIERHTGVCVEVTPLLRRHPILWGLKVAGRLLRRGVLR
ncbi:MAG: hypothetical protein LZF61_03115 [Nitrosomonas sp.]|nr:MAG: hypothetical protein LZF61_03115 [Nitrosomonas sp.]